jgi:hypothetical protein
MVDINSEKKLREILVKKPFLRVSYEAYNVESATVGSSNIPPAREDSLTYTLVSQAEFMREFSPTGHKINSHVYYPNRIKVDIDNEKKRFFEERMIRCTFPFQQIITTKHLCHLCGNDVQFELSAPKEKQEDTDLFFDFRKGWLNKNMEVTWYEAAKSAKITGDCAVVFYLKGGKVWAKNLSYLTGDVLYPHHDSITGDLDIFARTYNDVDSDNNLVARWCEVWDDKFLYRYKQGTTLIDKAKTAIKGIFGLDGYQLVSKEPHNFTSIPVAYHRVEGGACWTPAQDSIDKYELAVSHLCQNNMAYAFPIMFLKGEVDQIEGDDIYGAVKAVQMDKESDAGFLNKPDSSAAFDLQLRILLQNIFTGTFTVLPPEVKSGDMPGVAIKLLFSPAVEKAMADAKEFNPFIDKMTELFKEGYGIETGSVSGMKALSIFGWIKPYVHQNDTEIFTNAAAAVQNGFLSKESASEMATLLGYGKNYEQDRLDRERKEEMQADLLTDLTRRQNAAQVTDGRASSSSAINPASAMRTTDEHGNHPNENNWDYKKKSI